MPYRQLDRFQIKMEPLAARPNKFAIKTTAVEPDSEPGEIPAAARQAIREVAARIRAARVSQRPVICAFGAHAIKNGLAPVLIRLIEQRWVTHLAANGAGIIHDWEFAFQGASCEDVRQMALAGRFGNWQETGFYLNLALNLGAYEGKGYGESVGAMIEREGLEVPAHEQLRSAVIDLLDGDPRKAAAAADLLWVLGQFEIPSGWMPIPHPYKRYSAQAHAYRLDVPLTGHPMIGHDIIYNHPMSHGGCIGRCAERDYLTFAEAVSRLQHGVYLSVGSAVMSPMVFEKCFSMAQNLAMQHATKIDDFDLVIVDLAECPWDWSTGEPPESNPAYYLRYNKTFSRLGGRMRYLQLDNRDFLLELARQLGENG